MAEELCRGQGRDSGAEVSTKTALAKHQSSHNNLVTLSLLRNTAGRRPNTATRDKDRLDPISY